MFRHTPVTRREMLKATALGLLALRSLASVAWSLEQRTFDEPKRNPYRGSDDQLLDEIERAAYDFFWNEASSTTGQVRDRALINGDDHRRVASIAATGFGLTGLCIAESRGYGNPAAIRERVRQALRFLKRQLPHEHGFFYHFIDMETGERAGNCELSSIDTSLLLCGVLTARQHFNDAEIQDLATAIYERVAWPWMLNGGKTFSMGWNPGGGFLRSRLGALLRAHDALPARPGVAYAFCFQRNLEGMDASHREVSGIRVHFRTRPALYPPVFASVV